MLNSYWKENAQKTMQAIEIYKHEVGALFEKTLENIIDKLYQYPNTQLLVHDCYNDMKAKNPDWTYIKQEINHLAGKVTRKTA